MLGGDGVVQSKRGYIETVTMKAAGGRKTLGRWYDKSIESNLGPRGSIVRPEDQRRYSKSSRRDVEELTTDYVRENFQRRFVPLWRATKGVTVGGVMVLADKLLDLVEAGEISAGQARAYSGELVLAQVAEARGVPLGSRATRYRHRAALREHGLVLADGVLQEVEVDLHDVMEQVLEAEWGGSGGC
jgi:hypothetical protein